MLRFKLSFLLMILAPVASLDGCRTVREGHFYASPPELPTFHGGSTQIRVNLTESTSSYIVGPQPDGKTTAYGCEMSWNKLWGGSRCGYTHLHHEDSDRFVWRRHPDCILKEDGEHLKVQQDCIFGKKIQIAAYAYDMGNRPYQNSSLLTIFEHLLDIDAEYALSISYQQDKSVYELSLANGSLLESQTIKHTPCANFDKGYGLELYFGGECKAPQDVSICYSGETGFISSVVM